MLKKASVRFFVLLCLSISSAFTYTANYHDLAQAVYNEDINRVRELLRDEEVRRQVNTQDPFDRQTLLHTVARVNLPEILEVLLDAGADHTLQDDQDQTALDFALDANSLNAVNVLLRRFPGLVHQRRAGVDSTILNSMVYAGESYLPLIRALVEQHHAPINLEDIRVAQERGYQQIRQYLEEQRAQQQRNLTGQAVNLVAAGREHARQAVGGLRSYFGGWFSGGSN